MIWNAISALVAVVALIFAWHSHRALQKRNELGSRPLIVWDDKHISSDLSGQYGLFFKNIGKTPAINVSISQDYISRYNFLSAWNQIRREMAPGGETMCASGPKRFVPFIKQLTLTYEDPNGTKYSTIFENGKMRFE